MRVPGPWWCGATPTPPTTSLGSSGREAGPLRWSIPGALRPDNAATGQHRNGSLRSQVRTARKAKQSGRRKSKPHQTKITPAPQARAKANNAARGRENQRRP